MLPVEARLRLTPGPRQVELEYTGLSFVSPRNVAFKYRLAGLEHDWVEAGSRRAAYYSHLPPGDYRFELKACNNDGVWNEAGASLALTVLPHVWETVWFRLVCFATGTAGLVGTGWGIARRRARRRIARLERLHALEQERARIARDIHDQVGADLTHITLLGELAGRDSLSRSEVRSHVGQLIEGTRDLVKTMEEIVWAVNPRHDPLPNVSSYLCHFAQEYLRPTATRCRLEVMPALPPVVFSVHARHNLFLAVKEALHNVVRHAQATEVWLRVRFENGLLVVVVEDNGRGFDPARGRAGGNGLRNMRARLEELGGGVEFASAPGQGAKVRFTLPPDAERAAADRPRARWD
jgi:signal transduction histidine kinase